MAWLKTLTRNLLHCRAADRDLDAEIGAYADEMNARRAHSVYAEPLREQVRAARPGAGIESCARDLRYSLRMLRKTPWLSLACVLTFAVGVAATTVVFSMANALIWHPLPVANPAQLHLLSLRVQNSDAATPSLTASDLRALAAQARNAFSAVTTASLDGVGISADGQARIAMGGFVGGNFFAVMGIRPALGHFFSRDDASAVVLSYDYWCSRFHANPAVIGTAAVVEGRAVTITGVAPQGFHGITNVIDSQVYVPVGLAPNGNAGFLPAFGIPIVRLRPGVTVAAAQAELAVYARRMAVEHPKADQDLSIQMWPIGNGMTSSQGGPSPFATVAALFFVLSGLVLLLAAANIMGVLLARARTREREMAVRSALGAGRRRLARQVFLEALVLALGGCAAGMVFGMGASRALSTLPPQFGLPVVIRFTFDWRVFGFGCAMALVMAVAAGLLPAWRAASADPNQSLRGPEANATGRRRQWLRSSLVVAQVAGSLMLLIVGGLFVRSLQYAQHRPLGFQAEGLWNFELNVSGAGYTTAQGQRFFAQLLPAVRALPGVRGASLAMTHPFGTDQDDGPVHQQGKSTPSIDSTINRVSPEYFKTMEIPLLQGRAITANDTAHSPSVAVVSARLAQALWPGKSAVGQQVALGGAGQLTTVVGVAAEVLQNSFSAAQPAIYFALAQHYIPREILQVRTSGATPVSEVEQWLARMAPNVTIGLVQPMSAAQQGLNGLFIFNLGARLATALGLLGLFLAVIGVYGVVAYAAAQRTHEIGIRVALGARPRQVIVAILRSAGLIIASGIVIGLLLAAAIGKLAGAFLVGVSGLDPLTFIAATVLLALVAVAASLLPALRASRADPLAALRCE
ncbi:MAG: ABC transporter permease [Acidobacteria bacterium]|nr:MAG: ABC transporter permease [Acidobacteriota bacterium]